MCKIIRLTLLLLGLVAVGCSGETVKRTVYETLQNIREQECHRTPSVNCEKRDRLGVYEDKQQEAQQNN